ncbi:hypothetical protein DAI22_03g260700 [Oryza sativa Japonica Group]|nr:hypothetical protein DAI22_03g260700 [Oryza sativa Japonica Group]
MDRDQVRRHTEKIAPKSFRCITTISAIPAPPPASFPARTADIVSGRGTGGAFTPRLVRRDRSGRGVARRQQEAYTDAAGERHAPWRASAPPPLCLEHPIASSAASEKITVGMAVSVRTRVGKLRGGRRQLVLWLSAVVVSAAEEGYLTVLYKGNFPPEDPFKTVRVAAREEAKRMAAPAAAIATSTTALPSGNNAAAPRPTTAGKSVAVLKRVFSEAF